MPGDVLGTNLFNFQTNSFTLTKGPIFTELLLADEINRTPPKTQAALLQAMQERDVTIDGTRLSRSATTSWWWRRRTRSSSRAPIRCPRRSSTASCSSIVVDASQPRRGARHRAAPRPPHGDAAAGGLRPAPVADSDGLARMRAAGGEHPPGRRAARLHRRPDPRARASMPRCEFGASPARRQHAGRRRARLRGAAGARLRDPRRRQGARVAGRCATASSCRQRRDRGLCSRSHRAARSSSRTAAPR